MKKIEMCFENDISIGTGLDLFIKKCQIRNLTLNTIKSYQQKLNVFVKWLGGGSLDISVIGTPAIDNYILYLKGKGDNGTTINSHLRAIRAFCNFMGEQGYLPPIAIRLLKVEQTIKETYSEQELKVLLKKPNMRKVSFNEYKVWVLENYLLGTGNRISSALGIKIGDIDFNNAVVLLRTTKSRKQQVIPLTAVLVDILQEYLRYRGGSEEDYLFCNSCGGKADMRTIQQQVANYNHSRGVMKTSCHQFRHTFAKMFILNGGDAFRLQKLLGHSDMTITRNYVNMFGDDLSVNYERYNPLENIITDRAVIKLF